MPSLAAAPGPLCARALERVNLLGRDLDIYPRDVDGEPIDDLFTPAVSEHQVDHTARTERIPAPAARNVDYWDDLHNLHSQCAH